MGGLAALALALALVLAAESASALSPVGGEFQVNTYTSCNQRNPAVSGLASGGFVVVWASGSPAFQQDGSYSGIFGQRFDAEGNSVGAEFRSNQTTFDEQTDPDVAGLPNGGFVVVWNSYGQDGPYYYGVFGRRHNANGSTAGGEFQVNTYTIYGQYYPAVAATPGGFVVVWESCEQDGSREGIFGQRFDTSGDRVGTEFQANTFTEGRQRFPDISADANGNFVVVWDSEPLEGGPEQDGSGAGIFGQRYNADGSKTGAEFPVNTYTTDNQFLPAVAHAPDGSFLVTWEGRRPQGGNPFLSDDVNVRRFAANGMPQGDDFIANSYTSAFEEDVAIAFAGGEFLVAWETENDGVTGTDDDSEGAFARRLSVTGQALGTEFQANTFTVDEQDDPRVAGLTGGGFAVVWESSYQDGDQLGVYAQVYSGGVCGDGTQDGRVTAGDALFALQAAIGSSTCKTCVCDVNKSGGINASDALLTLQSAVGQGVVLDCVVC